MTWLETFNATDVVAGDSPTLSIVVGEGGRCLRRDRGFKEERAKVPTFEFPRHFCPFRPRKRRSAACTLGTFEQQCSAQNIHDLFPILCFYY